MKPILSLICLLLGFEIALGSSNGGFAGAFARLGAGARAKALGNAFTGVAHGPSAIYFNPAALPFHLRPEFHAATARLALDRRLDFIAVSAPVRPPAGAAGKTVNAGIGLGWLHAGVNNIDGRDFDGNPLAHLEQSSNLFLFSFGVQLHERAGIGLTAKMIYETFGRIGEDERGKKKSVNGDGLGLDFALFGKPVPHLTVGALLKDVAAKTTWSTTNYYRQGSTKTDNWPRQYRFGAAYERWGFLAAADIESSSRSETRFHAGLEGTRDITERYRIAGRFGFDDGAFAFGTGLTFSYWKVQATLDFTYVLENIAPDDASLLGFSVRF